MASAQPLDIASRLILEHRHLPVLTANFLRSRLPFGLEIADMVGAGNLGLCRAARDFDPSRGAAFQTFAITLIRGAILEMLRNWDHCKRSQREKQREGDAVPAPPVSLWFAPANCNGKNEDGTYAEILAEDAPGPYEAALAAVAGEALAAAIARLPERERFAVNAHFREGKTYRLISEALGVSESRAYQYIQQGLGRLRKNGALRELLEVSEKVSE